MAAYQISEKDIIHAGNLELLANHLVEGFISGLHKSPYHGFSVEFAEHRQYNTGESTKYIDWKLFAKTKKLFVKRFEEETNLRCQLILDTSKSMYVPYDGLSKLKFSAVSIASIAILLKKQRDATGLTIINDVIRFNSPPKISSVNQRQIFNEINNIFSSVPQTTTKGNIAANLHLLAESLHKRSLVVIFSDFFDNTIDEIADALKHLKYNKHDVVLFHVTDKKIEDEFNLPNRPYLLIDAETGEQIKIHANAVKDNYVANLIQFKNNLKLKCSQYNMDYIEAPVGTDFNTLLQQFFVKRGKLM